MRKDVPFIGHKNIIEQLHQWIQSWGERHTVCVSAEGGIGKSRLIRELYEWGQLKKENSCPLAICEIIDFDDLSLLSPKNVGNKIAQIDTEGFAPYLKSVQEYSDLQKAQASLETLEDSREKVTNLFIQCFNKVAENCRIVLFYDTTEHLKEGRGMWERLVDVGSHDQNVFRVLSGRNAKQIGLYLKENNKDREQKVHFINLPCLNDKESELYLKYKQEICNVNISKKDLPLLVLHAEGKPILLDLVIEWLFRFGENLTWLFSPSLVNLSREERRFKFEELLVKGVGKIEHPMDRLILSMSHVYPLNIKMIDFLISKEDPNVLFEDAKTYIFIKQLPDGRITLHDEVRRMIQTYVLPKDDSKAMRRLKLYSRKILSYFETEIKRLEDLLEKTEEYLNVAEILRRRNALFLQYVIHAMFADVKKGTSIYNKIIWQLRREHQIQGALQVQRSIQGYIENFDEQQLLQYNILRARLLNDEGRVGEAEKLLLGLLERYGNTLESKATIINALAVSEVGLGKLSSARRHQIECLKIFAEIGNILPDIPNYAGYIHERLGELNAAVEYYNDALKIAIKSKTSRNLIANILDNLSHAYCQLGQYYDAQVYIERALTIWKKLRRAGHIARGEITQAIIYRDQGKFNSATDLFDKAINKLKEPDDYRMLIKAYLHLGWTRRLQGAEEPGHHRYNIEALKEAKQALESGLHFAQKYHSHVDYPGLFHHLAIVHWILGNREEARTMNDESFRLSVEIQDIRYAVDSLVGKAEFDFEEGDYQNINKYSKMLKDDYEDRGYKFPLYYGRMKRIEADVAFSNQQYQAALTLYIAGMSQILLYDQFRMRFVPRELAALQEKLENLPPRTAQNWCLKMKNSWQADKSKVDYSELQTWCDKQLKNIELRLELDFI